MYIKNKNENEDKEREQIDIDIDEEFEQQLKELMKKHGENETDLFQDIQKSHLLKTVATITFMKYKKTIIFTMIILFSLLLLISLNLI